MSVVNREQGGHFHVTTFMPAAACLMSRTVAPGWSAGSENYCYTEGSCYGDKIPALSGELLVSKTHCCESLSGASWGGQNVSQCESCSQQTDTELPLFSYRECIQIASYSPYTRHYAPYIYSP